MPSNVINLRERLGISKFDNFEKFVQDLNSITNKGIVLKEWSLLQQGERWNQVDLDDFMHKMGYDKLPDRFTKYEYTLRVPIKVPEEIKPVEIKHLKKGFYRCIAEHHPVLPFGEIIHIKDVMNYAGFKLVEFDEIDALYKEEDVIGILEEVVEEDLYPEYRKDNQFEIVIALDTTGSMSHYRNRIRDNFDILIGKVINKYPNVKLSFIQFGDYVDYPRHIKIGQLTNDIKELKKQIEPFDTYGGDDEEFYEYVLKVINDNEVNYTSNNKIIILLFDNSYHILGENIQMATPFSNNTKKCTINIKDEYKRLKENNIKLYGITVDPNDEADVFMTEISKEFGTPELDFTSNPNIITELITGIILKNVDEKGFETYSSEQDDDTLKTLFETL